MDQGTDPVTGRTADVRIDTARTSGDPDAIADDIRETRAEMDETIDALSAKLDPSHLIDQAKEAFTSSAKDAGTSMMDQLKDSSFLDTIKDNPIPAAAVGLSVAWFLSKMGESESDRYRGERFRATGDPYYAPRRRYGAGRYDAFESQYDTYDTGYGSRAAGGSGGNGDSLGDKASDALDTAKNKAAGAVDSVKETASHLANSAQNAVSGSADAGRDRARQLGQQVDRYERKAASWLDHQMQANPLSIGAVALAAGALIGLSVPESDAENQAFGGQADQVKNQLAEVAQEKAGQVTSAAQNVVEEAKGKAQEVADEAADKGQSVADDAADRAKSVAGTAETEAKKAADTAEKAADSATTSGSAS